MNIDIQNTDCSITVYPKDKNERIRKIRCKGEWFNDAEYFEFIEEDYFLIIKKCFLEIPKKAIKLPKRKCFDMVSKLPIGTFNIDDEESNEDELVIYYS